MDDKPSPPTTDDAPDVPHTARKRKLTLKTRARSKKEHQGAWRTTETPAEPPTDDDDDNNNNNNNNTLIREMDAPCDEPAIHLKSHSSSSPTTMDKKSFLYTPKTTRLEPQSSFPPSITRINNNIHNNHHQNRHDKRTPFERALNTGIVLCAISTLLALLLLLDAYEYVVVPGSSKPKSPILRSDASTPVSTMIPEVGTAPAVAAAAAVEVAVAPVPEPHQTTTENHTLKDEMEQAQRTVEQKLHELHTLSTTEIEARAESDGIDDTALLATESSDKSSQEINVQKEQLVEQIAEKELGIDEFCPECMWQQTSIQCQARFHFIQEVYHNDPDDVVKKALLDQGCRKKSENHTLKNEMEQAQRSVEQKLHELHTLSTAEMETRAESDGIDDTALLAAESSDKTLQEMNVQKAQLVEQIAEKELGIDEFCPECMWKQTSIQCQARFHFIQEVYHNDPDDVVKKALLDQGCRKKSKGARRRTRRRRRGRRRQLRGRVKV